ncbi:Iduronate 2-sulfatase [Seminavis robusta]|uniref:Iduronate 2-sulfatase n=1 Tax=Seminavis robusta TaxID=568900 RepID=A0A9N8DY97_9STRA|nr:Iduronate 2-sulfatase [Seminavis robusta]|eukprot:Sro373_g129010.1 Iduronate 2-sulfatase (544) ;mRNA; f:25610-27331
MVAKPLPQLILLFVTDQFRYDAFQPTVTPNLYQLSLDSKATTFTNAYVSTPTCTPARASLLTGKSPWAHGMLGYSGTVNCQEYPTTLPGMLSDLAGYETFSVGKNHFGWDKTAAYVTHDFQHLEVYDALDYEPRPDDYLQYFHELYPGKDPLSVTCDRLGYNDWRACPYGGANETQHPTEWTTRQALRYLQEFDFSDKNQKMFLKVSYHRPHSPYDPPQRLFDKHLHSKIEPERFVNKSSWDQQWYTTRMPKDAYHGDPGEEKAHYTRAGYLASVEFVDEGMGRILDYLRQHALLEQSLVLWTSDHGDQLGDHYLWRKGYPYEASSHINMIIKLPQGEDDSSSNSSPDFRRQNQESTTTNTEPKTSPALVEIRDVATTLYDYVGILEKVQKRDPLVNGKSLLPILEGDETMVRSWLDLEHSVVYSHNIHWNAIVGFYPDDDVDFQQSDRRDARQESSNLLLWKYIFHVYDGDEQLFCLSRDPQETYDVSETKPDILKHWRATMVSQFQEEGRGEEWVRDDHLIVHRPAITYGPNFPCKERIKA